MEEQTLSDIETVLKLILENPTFDEQALIESLDLHLTIPSETFDLLMQVRDKILENTK